MDIMELGALGEFVSSIGVIATLIYLATQIRQNTKVARADMSKDLMLTSRSAIWELAANQPFAPVRCVEALPDRAGTPKLVPGRDNESTGN